MGIRPESSEPESVADVDHTALIRSYRARVIHNKFFKRRIIQTQLPKTTVE